MESKVVQEWQAEALKRGREEGERKGAVKGALKATREAVASVLVTRFGMMPDDLKRKLTAIKTASTLANLVPVAAQAPSLAEFRRLAQL